jgi:hypothetical protein
MPSGKPGGGYILVKNGLWILPRSIDDEPVQLTRAIPYASTTIDVTPGGVYFVTDEKAAFISQAEEASGL